MGVSSLIAAAEAGKYVMGGYGQHCPKGSADITSKSDCQAAVTALGRKYSGDASNPNIPLGCLTWDDKQAVYNNPSHGAEAQLVARLCKQPTVDLNNSLASSGHMSVLGGSVVDGKCEYADTTNGGVKSPAATSPQVVSGRYCGVSEKMFAGGANCGACYKVSYSGEGGTNPGRAGSAVVQVVNQASEVFACHKDVFHTITGATTGIFPITYTEVACEVESTVGVATVLDGKNAYYTKAIFSDLPHAVSSAKLKIGEKSFPMDRVAGATFKANTDGDLASASFELTLADGRTNKLTPCFDSWPVATGSSCAPKAVVGETDGSAAVVV